MKTLMNLSRFWCVFKKAYGTLIGTTACVVQAMRWTRTKPYIVVTGVFGLLGSYFGSFNAGGIVSGVNNIDTVRLNREYLAWVEKTRG